MDDSSEREPGEHGVDRVIELRFARQTTPTKTLGVEAIYIHIYIHRIITITSCCQWLSEGSEGY